MLQHGRRIIARLFLDERDDPPRHHDGGRLLFPVHRESAEAFVESHDRDMPTIAGKVMMDRNAPDGLTDTLQSGYDDTKALDRRNGNGKGRSSALRHHAALRHHPRRLEQMEMAGALAKLEFPWPVHPDPSVGKP